jgi:hypothetical protein
MNTLAINSEEGFILGSCSLVYRLPGDKIQGCGLYIQKMKYAQKTLIHILPIDGMLMSDFLRAAVC